jgi:hypothetical protein
MRSLFLKEKERLFQKIQPFFTFQLYLIMIMYIDNEFLQILNQYSFYLIVPFVFVDFLVLLFLCFRCF